MRITVNGKDLSVPENWQDESLLIVLREVFGLVGAKFGCGLGQCGACTVLVDGEAVRACITPIDSVGDARVTTIEGLARGAKLHPVQRAWLDEAVPQCGYCQAGQIMSAVALLQGNPKPDRDAVDAAMDGNLCRCGTYDRIRKAIARASETMRDGSVTQ